MTERDARGVVPNGVTVSGRTLSRGGRTSLPRRHARLSGASSRAAAWLELAPRAKTVRQEPAR